MNGAKIIVFPGSNCEKDAHLALLDLGFNSKLIWHKEGSIKSPSLIVIPGGFSYGDYLRAGAIAKASPIMREIKRHAKRGVPILGICNGFQILLEAGLLPGAMKRNASLHFVCKQQWITSHSHTPFNAFEKKILSIPIAHGEGNYWIDNPGLESLLENEQIVFRYSNAEGECFDDANPNGSVFNIAGICSREGKVLGMMPHPERACDESLGSVDGRHIFQSLLNMEV